MSGLAQLAAGGTSMTPTPVEREKVQLEPLAIQKLDELAGEFSVFALPSLDNDEEL